MTGADAVAAAIAVEARKTVASRVVRTATVAIVIGIAILAGSLTRAAEEGNERVLTQLGPLATATGADRFLGIAAQISGAAALLGCGIVFSWMIGREFVDGTVTGLFALPVSRSTIVLAKLMIYLAWALVLAAALTSTLALTGFALGLGPLDPAGLIRQYTLIVLSAGLGVPAGWAATVGRGPLPGIATAICTIVIAQVTVVAGTGAWLPLAAPTLWALEPDRVTIVQLTMAATVPAAFGVAIIRSWSRLQLVRDTQRR